MIMQNGKRLDGFGIDNLPIGTIQAFAGLVAPTGYLFCEGQKIKKDVYRDLYDVIGGAYGAETSTEFYLPNLSGKVIAGLSPDLLPTLGSTTGDSNHTHNVSGHTHTIDDHNHITAAHTHTTGDHALTATELPGGVMIDGTNNKNWCCGHWDNYSGYSYCFTANNTSSSTATGGIYGKAHNHGNTGLTSSGSTTSVSLTTNANNNTNTSSTSNYQPTIGLKYIIKAYVVLPQMAGVYNGLDSDSTTEALSAKQGKTLKNLIDAGGGSGGGGVYIDTEEPENEFINFWINPENDIDALATEVVNNMNGDEENMAPSVAAVKSSRKEPYKNLFNIYYFYGEAEPTLSVSNFYYNYLRYPIEAFNLEVGKTYTYQSEVFYNYNNLSAMASLVFYDDNGVVVGENGSESVVTGIQHFTFTIPEGTTEIEYRNNRYNTQRTNTIKIRNIQIEEGSNMTNWVPYKIEGMYESGKNSNGSWIKYSDGTMIQYGYYTISNLTFTSATPSYSATQSHTLPISFYNNKYGISISCVTSSISWIGNINPSAASFSFIVVQNNATTRNATITWKAIGRWK